MEREGDVRVHHHMSALGQLEVLTQQGAVNGMSGVLDDFVSALHGILTAQVIKFNLFSNDVNQTV